MQQQVGTGLLGQAIGSHPFFFFQFGRCCVFLGGQSPFADRIRRRRNFVARFRWELSRRSLDRVRSPLRLTPAQTNQQTQDSD